MATRDRRRPAQRRGSDEQLDRGHGKHEGRGSRCTVVYGELTWTDCGAWCDLLGSWERPGWGASCCWPCWPCCWCGCCCCCIVDIAVDLWRRRLKLELYRSRAAIAGCWRCLEVRKGRRFFFGRRGESGCSQRPPGVVLFPALGVWRSRREKRARDE